MPWNLCSIQTGITARLPVESLLDLHWNTQVFPNVRRELFADADRAGYSQPKVEVSQVKAAIFGHPEFTAFNQLVTKLFAEWKAANTLRLAGIKQGDRPKVLIETLSESLLETFRGEHGVASLISSIYMCGGDRVRHSGRPSFCDGTGSS